MDWPTSPSTFTPKVKRICYKSPMEKAIQDRFNQEKMRTSFSSNPNVVRDTFQDKTQTKVDRRKDSIQDLNVSPKMKSFIKTEFIREKLKFSYFPVKQVELQVIHRFKLYLRNTDKKTTQITKNSRSKRSHVRRLSFGSDVSSLSSVQVIPGNDEKSDDDGNDSEDKDMAETWTSRKKKINKNTKDDYLDDNFCVIPQPKTFQICPNQIQISSTKHLLVCFHADNDTDTIVDLSQKISDIQFFNRKASQEEQATPTKLQIAYLRKDLIRESLRKKRKGQDMDETWSSSYCSRNKLMKKQTDPKLPYLLSRSFLKPQSRSLSDLDKFLALERCFACLTRKQDLLVCSGCNTAVYCHQNCQRTTWKFHQKFCKNIKSDEPTKKMEEILLKHLNHAELQVKTAFKEYLTQTILDGVFAHISLDKTSFLTKEKKISKRKKPKKDKLIIPSIIEDAETTTEPQSGLNPKASEMLGQPQKVDANYEWMDGLLKDCFGGQEEEQDLDIAEMRRLDGREEEAPGPSEMRRLEEEAPGGMRRLEEEEDPDLGEMRRLASEAANKRQKEREGRGFKDPEGVKRRIKLKEKAAREMEQGGGGQSGGMKWQVFLN